MGKYIGATEAPVLKSNNHYMTQAFKSGSHNGIDLIKRGKVWTPAAKTDDIIAIADGTVTYTGYSDSRGYYVEIKHSNNYKSRYLHLKKGSIVVKKGQFVNKGTKLGFMGNTGNSDGAHLHLAVIDTKNKYVDPLPYLLGTKTFDGKVQMNAYQSYDKNKKKWLPKVDVNSNDYAGIFGDSLTGIYLDKGNVRVHTLKGKWLPEVKDHNDYAGILSKKIDAVSIKGDGLKYRVHIKNGKWLPYVTGYDINNSNNGYAGILGKEIDAIQIMKK